MWTWAQGTTFLMRNDRRGVYDPPSFSDRCAAVESKALHLKILFLTINSTMSPLSPARRQANLQRRRNLNAEIRRLKNYYSGTFTGQFGRTATTRQMNTIREMIHELAARRIQAAVRRRQATARAHTRARAPLNNVLAAALHPRRIGYLKRTYGNISNKY